jgi:hypothetical protein
LLRKEESITMIIKGLEIPEHIRKDLEKKIEKNNKKICKFIKGTFGLRETYLSLDPKFTTDEGDELKGWGDIASYLGKKPDGMECTVKKVLVEIEASKEEGFDYKAHVKTEFSFGESDPSGEGNLKHRDDCEWVPAGEG